MLRTIPCSYCSIVWLCIPGKKTIELKMLSLRSANWLLEMHYLPARIQQKQIKRMPYHTEHQENTSHESIEFSTLAKTCTKFTTKQKTKCSATQPMARIQCFAIRICCGWVDIPVRCTYHQFISRQQKLLQMIFASRLRQHQIALRW